MDLRRLDRVRRVNSYRTERYIKPIGKRWQRLIAVPRGEKGGRTLATDAGLEADTFPKLLLRNARIYAARPAVRHKDLGIWQTWTWAQVLDEVRAFSVGLQEVGLKP